MDYKSLHHHGGLIMTYDTFYDDDEDIDSINSNKNNNNFIYLAALKKIKMSMVMTDAV